MKSHSLINKTDSTAIKGLAILLIIFGHNMFLAQYTEDSGVHFHTWFLVLYKFHVIVFFILPFLYGCKLTKKREVLPVMKRDFIKMYIPYLWFLVICVFEDYFINRHFDINGIIKAFIIGGSQDLWNSAIGCKYLWFMPTMAIFLLWRNIWFLETRKCVHVLFVCISFLLTLFWTFSTQYLSYIPLSIGFSFRILWPAICCRYIIEHIDINIKRSFISLLCLLGVVSFFIYAHSLQKDLLFIAEPVCRLFCPILFFVFIYGIREVVSSSKFFHLMGTYSFHIYLIHLFIYGGLAMVAKKLLFTCNQYVSGIVILVLTVAVSLFISAVICKWLPKVNKYVFGIKIL